MENIEARSKCFTRIGTVENKLKLRSSEVITALMYGQDVEIQYTLIEGDLNFREVLRQSEPGKSDSFGLASSIRIRDSEICGSIDFRYIIFKGSVDFSGSKFGKQSVFTGTIFGGDAQFGRTQFITRTYIDHARFKRDALFTRAVFEGSASFDSTSFDGNAYFGGSGFSLGADFAETVFRGDSILTGSSFGGNAFFNKADFNRKADFKGVSFREGAYFGGAKFNGTAEFTGTCFSKETIFADACFGETAGFGNTKFSANPDLHRMKLDSFAPSDLENLGWSYIKSSILGAGRLFEQAGEKYCLKGRYSEASQGFRNAKMEYEKEGKYDEAGAMYVKEKESTRLSLKAQKRNAPKRSWFWIWKYSSNYGESPWRFIVWMVAIILFFALVYMPIAPGWISWWPVITFKDYPFHQWSDGLMNGFLFNVGTALYFSIVTFATLGFGDIAPVSLVGKLCASLEVLFGYIMFGILITLVARKMTRI